MASRAPGLGRCRVRGDELVPSWLGPADGPWLTDLLELYDACVGAPRRVLDRHLAAFARDPRSNGGVAAARAVLDRDYRSDVDSKVPPREVRALVFRLAADRRPRSEALRAAARELRLEVGEVERALLADVPGERRTAAPEARASPIELAQRANLAIAQSALGAAHFVEIRVRGHARRVIRQAALRGLICEVVPGGSYPGPLLRISGPMALFRRTAMYGRHLRELLPLLVWSRTFELDARCAAGGRELRLALRSGDPLPPVSEPRAYDSRVERTFARDFLRAAPDWDLLREPEPVAADGGLLFPDFALWPRSDPRRRWLLEIVGFWTRSYLERKLRRLRGARIQRLVLCIDAERDCGEDELPADAPVIRYRRRIDVAEVMRALGESRR